jgi:phenolic acid decarboxylase
MPTTEADGIQKAIQMVAMHGVIVFGQYQENEDPEMVGYYNAQMDVIENIIKDLKRLLKDNSDAP